MLYELESISEEIENFFYLKGTCSDVIILVLGTHESEIGGLCCFTVGTRTNNASAHVDFQLAPVSTGVELQEANEVLAEQELLLEVGQRLVLLKQVLENHAEEQVRANVAMVGLGVPPYFEHALQGHEQKLELWQPVLHPLDFQQLLQPIFLIHRDVEHEVVGADVDNGHLAPPEV